MAETTQESTGIPEETPVYHDISPYVEGDLRASYHMVADLTEQSRDTGEMLTKSYYTTSRGNGEDDKITVTAGLSFDQVQQEFPESLGKLTHFLHMDPDTINKSFDRFTVCKVEYLDGKGQEASYAFVDPASNENLAEQAEESNDVHYDMMDHFAKCTVNNVSSRSFDGLMDADSERADMHILPYQELAAGGGLEDAVDNDTEEEMEGSSDEDPDLWENYDDFDTDSEVDEESFDAYDVLIQDMAEHGESTGPDIPADYHPASDFADYAEEEESESYQDYDWIYSPIDQEPEPEVTTQGTAVDQKDDRTFLQQHSDELFPHIEDSPMDSYHFVRDAFHDLVDMKLTNPAGFGGSVSIDRTYWGAGFMEESSMNIRMFATNDLSSLPKAIQEYKPENVELKNGNNYVFCDLYNPRLGDEYPRAIVIFDGAGDTQAYQRLDKYISDSTTVNPNQLTSGFIREDSPLRDELKHQSFGALCSGRSDVIQDIYNEDRISMNDFQTVELFKDEERTDPKIMTDNAFASVEEAFSKSYGNVKDLTGQDFQDTKDFHRADYARSDTIDTYKGTFYEDPDQNLDVYARLGYFAPEYRVPDYKENPDGSSNRAEIDKARADIDRIRESNPGFGRFMGFDTTGRGLTDRDGNLRMDRNGNVITGIRTYSLKDATNEQAFDRVFANLYNDQDDPHNTFSRESLTAKLIPGSVRIEIMDRTMFADSIEVPDAKTNAGKPVRISPVELVVLRYEIQDPYDNTSGIPFERAFLADPTGHIHSIADRHWNYHTLREEAYCPALDRFSKDALQPVYNGREKMTLSAEQRGDVRNMISKAYDGFKDKIYKEAQIRYSQLPDVEQMKSAMQKFSVIQEKVELANTLARPSLGAQIESLSVKRFDYILQNDPEKTAEYFHDFYEYKKEWTAFNSPEGAEGVLKASNYDQYKRIAAYVQECREEVEKDSKSPSSIQNVARLYTDAKMQFPIEKVSISSGQVEKLQNEIEQKAESYNAGVDEKYKDSMSESQRAMLKVYKQEGTGDYYTYFGMKVYGIADYSTNVMQPHDEAGMYIGHYEKSMDQSPDERKVPPQFKKSPNALSIDTGDPISYNGMTEKSAFFLGGDREANLLIVESAFVCSGADPQSFNEDGIDRDVKNLSKIYPATLVNEHPRAALNEIFETEGEDAFKECKSFADVVEKVDAKAHEMFPDTVERQVEENPKDTEQQEHDQVEKKADSRSDTGGKTDGGTGQPAPNPVENQKVNTGRRPGAIELIDGRVIDTISMGFARNLNLDKNVSLSADAMKAIETRAEDETKDRGLSKEQLVEKYTNEKLGKLENIRNKIAEIEKHQESIYMSPMLNRMYIPYTRDTYEMTKLARDYIREGGLVGKNEFLKVTVDDYAVFEARHGYRNTNFVDTIILSIYRSIKEHRDKVDKDDGAKVEKNGMEQEENKEQVVDQASSAEESRHDGVEKQPGSIENSMEAKDAKGEKVEAALNPSDHDIETNNSAKESKVDTSQKSPDQGTEQKEGSSVTSDEQKNDTEAGNDTPPETSVEREPSDGISGQGTETRDSAAENSMEASPKSSDQNLETKVSSVAITDEQKTEIEAGKEQTVEQQGKEDETGSSVTKEDKYSKQDEHGIETNPASEIDTGEKENTVDVRQEDAVFLESGVEQKPSDVKPDQGTEKVGNTADNRVEETPKPIDQGTGDKPSADEEAGKQKDNTEAGQVTQKETENDPKQVSNDEHEERIEQNGNSSVEANSKDNPDSKADVDNESKSDKSQDESRETKVSEEERAEEGPEKIEDELSNESVTAGEEEEKQQEASPLEQTVTQPEAEPVTQEEEAKNSQDAAAMSDSIPEDSTIDQHKTDAASEENQNVTASESDLQGIGDSIHDYVLGQSDDTADEIFGRYSDQIEDNKKDIVKTVAKEIRETLDDARDNPDFHDDFDRACDMIDTFANTFGDAFEVMQSVVDDVFGTSFPEYLYDEAMDKCSETLPDLMNSRVEMPEASVDEMGFDKGGQTLTGSETSGMSAIEIVADSPDMDQHSNAFLNDVDQQWQNADLVAGNIFDSVSDFLNDLHIEIPDMLESNIQSMVITDMANGVDVTAQEYQSGLEDMIRNAAENAVTPNMTGDVEAQQNTGVDQNSNVDTGEQTGVEAEIPNPEIDTATQIDDTSIDDQEQASGYDPAQAMRELFDSGIDQQNLNSSADAASDISSDPIETGQSGAANALDALNSMNPTEVENNIPTPVDDSYQYQYVDPGVE